MSRIRDIANILSGVSTDMATDAEVTSSIASHAAAADPHTVYLKTATASSTYAPLSNPTFTAIGGDEGGQINLAAAATNTTLSGPINFDIYQNKFRIFESGGSTRGASLDLTTLSNSVGSELLASAPQTGNSGKYLTTNGTNASWGTVTSAVTLIQNASGSGSTVSFSSIPQTYKSLKIIGYWVTAGSGYVYFTTNTSGTLYTGSLIVTSSTTYSYTQTAQANVAWSPSAGNPVVFELIIPSYTMTTTGKIFASHGGTNNGAWQSGNAFYAGGGILNNTSISSLTFAGGSGTYNLSLYGLM